MCGRFQSFHRPTCSGGMRGFSSGRRYSMRCGWARGLVTHTFVEATQNSPGCGSVVQRPMWSKAFFMVRGFVGSDSSQRFQELPFKCLKVIRRQPLYDTGFKFRTSQVNERGLVFATPLANAHEHVL